MIGAAPTYDERLAQRIRDGDEDAAVQLFDRHEPTSLAAACALLSTYGVVTPETFDDICRTYDRYRHFRDMPRD